MAQNYLQKSLNRAQEIGKHRDTLLVSIAATYGLGYLAWSIFAWRQNLGLLPALDFQYMVAGAGLVLFIVFGVAVVRASISAGHLLETALSGIAAKHDMGNLLIFVLGVIALVLFIILSADAGKLLIEIGEARRSGVELVRADLALTYAFMRIGFVAILLTGLATILADLLASPKAVFRATGRRVLLTIFGGVAALLILATLAAYLLVIYPGIPSEFGGLRPRCAFLDVDRALISNETYTTLFNDVSPVRTTDVVRSIRLTVYFANNQYLLVRPIDEGPDSPTIQIRSDTISLVTWCGKGSGY